MRDWEGKRCGGWGCICLALILASGCESRHESGTPGGASSDGEGVRIEQDWELRNVQTSATSTLFGHRGKVVFLNVWATWCPPCVREMPSIARLHEQFRDNPNVAFVLVSVDDDPDTVVSFLEEHGYTMPTYMATSGSSTPSVLRTDGIPATFIIDGEGVIRRSQVGAMEWDSPAIVSEIESLSREAGSRRS